MTISDYEGFSRWRNRVDAAAELLLIMPDRQLEEPRAPQVEQLLSTVLQFTRGRVEDLVEAVRRGRDDGLGADWVVGSTLRVLY